jgi:hypothetical protein
MEKPAAGWGWRTGVLPKNLIPLLSAILSVSVCVNCLIVGVEHELQTGRRAMSNRCHCQSVTASTGSPDEHQTATCEPAFEKNGEKWIHPRWFPLLDDSFPLLHVFLPPHPLLPLRDIFIYLFVFCMPIMTLAMVDRTMDIRSK